VITGAHAIVYCTDAEANRAFFRDVLGIPSVDAGDGWLIFALPPAELAIHPGDENDRHELFLMTDDVKALVASLDRQGIAASPVVDRGWGLLTQVTLPGGGALGVYQPRHASPPRRAATVKRTAGTRPARKRTPRRSQRSNTVRRRTRR
jgi:catechol 2,3-dioxygenase-like lactoylglutathione lyase family enzyme